jgi:hypothetical protein
MSVVISSPGRRFQMGGAFGTAERLVSVGVRMEVAATGRLPAAATNVLPYRVNVKMPGGTTNRMVRTGLTSEYRQ